MPPELLLSQPLFAGVAPSLLADAAPLFQLRSVFSGGTLWYEREPAGALAIVVDGGLAVRVGVREVGRIAPGELVGEASAFFGEPRIATVTVTAPTRLLVLDRASLGALRASHPQVYDPLLQRALEAMARRVRDADRRISDASTEGTDAPMRIVPLALDRVFRAFSGPEKETPPGIYTLLRRLPRLNDAPVDVLTILAAALTPRRVEEGDPVFLEGDAGDSAFVLTEGSLDVLREIYGGKASTLATLERGAVFGTGSLLLGERRNASCIARTACWVHELPAAAHASLRGEAGRLWRESLLSALRAQVVLADGLLADLAGGTTDAEREKLREAAAQVLAYRVDDIPGDPWGFTVGPDR
ncbi:MAG: cyclic nucleotide-binding domain-containing protein [Pseudomonadota bacterium]|nr:cyclic nucleotide-binding domain-containing protein [Pseudomonadota bacterium]